MAKILIVDDSADLITTLTWCFENAGHEVQSAPNGREALVFVISQTPDVILLDLVMPVMDGASLLEVVRSYLRIHSLPVVLLTGFPESLLLNRAKALNVNTVLLKANTSSEEILRAVEAACN